MKKTTKKLSLKREIVVKSLDKVTGGLSGTPTLCNCQVSATIPPACMCK